MSQGGSSTPELFAVAISLAPEERERYLDEVCCRDTTLRDELDVLIESHERARDFLESPPIDLSGAPPMPLPGEEEPAPAKIGNYRVVRVLGSGGMGRVYLAESEKPKRLVALKVIKPGTASKAMLRRFEQEAQVVALLQHPGIAQIFEAGTAIGGAGPQPYIAMEYVDGPLLTEYINRQSMDVRAKLHLFCKICDAVTHAHHKGVIHRDLKPANILVDASGQPKILDFGVARLTDPDTASQTLHTHAGQLIGTLAYMSPEQVAGEPGKVDSRSDVYALGVILYEILTGKLPHDVNQRPIPEAIRIIREDTPTSLSSLDRGYRGDIETIVSKALEKETERRYQSPNELADDIRRSLRDEPIVARRPSTWYQFRKFAKRNKALVGGVAATMAALAIGLVTALSQAQAAHVAKNEALDKGKELETALAQVQEHLEVARGLNVFLEGLVESPDPDEHLGRDVTVLEALERSEQDLEQAMPKQPSVRGAIHRSIGQTYRSLAEYSKAEPHLRQAYQLHLASYGPEHHETIHSLAMLCNLLSEFGKSEDALELAEPVWKRVEATQGESSASRVMLAGAIGSLYADVERLPEALTLAEYAAAQHEQTKGPLDPTTLNARYSVARLLSRLGEYNRAIPMKRDVIEKHRSTERGPSARSVIWYVGLGIDLADVNQLDELEDVLAEVLPMAQSIYSPDHPGMLAVMNLKGSYTMGRGDAVEAERIFRDVVERHRRTETPLDEGLVRVLSNLGGSLRAQGKLKEAEAAFREGLGLLSGPGSHPNRVRLAMLTNLATTIRLQNRFDEASVLYKEAVETGEKILNPGDWTIAAHRYGYGLCLLAARKPVEAERELLLAEAVVSKMFAENDERVVSARRSLVNLYDLWDKPEKVNAWRAKLPEQYQRDE